MKIGTTVPLGKGNRLSKFRGKVSITRAVIKSWNTIGRFFGPPCISRYRRCIKICENLIGGPLRALKALKALKRPKLGYKLGDHFVRKRKEIEA